MSPADPVVSALHEGMRRFLALVAGIRPDLHRYCARMTGSVADGEDIVQDTLARAYYALSEMESVPELRPWLFQIAHNRALDHLRRYERRMSEPLDSVVDSALSSSSDPEERLAREQATQAAISRFVELVPLQRSALILKDVLGHSLTEVAQLLSITEPAAKAALHRGRVRLQALAAVSPEARPSPPVSVSPGVARYVALFNARDWDGVRALLAEDVRLDLVSRAKRTGREVASYVERYSQKSDWYMTPGTLDGREVILVFRTPSGVTQRVAGAHARPGYFIELQFAGERVTMIRDFRYVPYILAEASGLMWLPPA
ncbi:MAG TPA: sigma-70 family RNA polymerase sigma factor [Polyangiaceae bacterium]|nr:sigma-70 family RNA polymerase sigma factor [Polyangiaceae bacterium]